MCYLNCVVKKIWNNKKTVSLKYFGNKSKNTVSPLIKGKSNLSCQPHFLHFFRENFPCGFAVENFHEKECGGNPNSI